MIINCPCCSLVFKQEPLFLAHLSAIHNKTDHLQFYLDVYFDSIHPTCTCFSDCKEKLKWSGWNKGFQSKFVRGHNSKISSTFKDLDKQAEFTKKRISNYANGATVWNKGLTKETSIQIKESSEKISSTLKQRYESGLISWQSNKTKENSESIKKMSDTKKRKFSSGELSIWNSGLTKETHASLDSASKKISIAYAKREMGRRITESDLLERVSKFSDKFELVSDSSLYKTRRVARLCFKCVKCKAEQLKSLAMLEESPVCFFCAPKESAGQLELFEFVKSIASDAVLSDRTIIAPKELDVWVPSRKLGIEFNGLYWHSSKVISDELYHLKKEIACTAANVVLLSIFEDEWRDKRQLIESMIKHRLGIDTIKINARSLKVCTLNSKDSKEFFNKNHLDGYTPAQQTFALKDIATGIVFAALSLRRPFHKKYASRLEVARCACLMYHNVRGWLGKLTKVALTYALSLNKDGLMTYVDGRIGKGQSYDSAGWIKQICSNQPRFWWTDFENKYNRFQYKANKKENKTEEQVALEANVVKIFGCSNSLYFYD